MLWYLPVPSFREQKRFPWFLRRPKQELAHQRWQGALESGESRPADHSARTESLFLHLTLDQ